MFLFFNNLIRYNNWVNKKLDFFISSCIGEGNKLLELKLATPTSNVKVFSIKSQWTADYDLIEYTWYL